MAPPGPAPKAPEKVFKLQFSCATGAEEILPPTVEEEGDWGRGTPRRMVVSRPGDLGVQCLARCLDGSGLQSRRPLPLPALAGPRPHMQPLPYRDIGLGRRGASLHPKSVVAL